jgi:hypothetical protein
MNNDGWGQGGAGQDDRRLAGRDLQHAVQNKTADEGHIPVRRVVQNWQDGGPMKHHMEHEHHKHEHGHEHHSMHDHLADEMKRHEHAKHHHMHHMERHHNRPFDSQHGHDHYKHGKM